MRHQQTGVMSNGRIALTMCSCGWSSDWIDPASVALEYEAHLLLEELNA